jgi:hypothetical protein
MVMGSQSDAPEGMGSEGESAGHEASASQHTAASEILVEQSHIQEEPVKPVLENVIQAKEEPAAKPATPAVREENDIEKYDGSKFKRQVANNRCKWQHLFHCMLESHGACT